MLARFFGRGPDVAKPVTDIHSFFERQNCSIEYTRFCYAIPQPPHEHLPAPRSHLDRVHDGQIEAQSVKHV